MRLDQLPQKFMKKEVSSPTLDGLIFLEKKYITNYISDTYISLEARAEAFDGAFCGFHIYNHISRGGSEQDQIEEIECAYEFAEYKNLDGPFHDCLQVTLQCCNLGELYEKALVYIIAKKNKKQ